MVKRKAAVRKFEAPQYELTDTLSVARSTLYQKSQLAPYNPDDLVQKFGASGQGLDKYEKMLTDDAVKAALSTKKSAVIASGWLIEPADETPEAQEKADFVTNNFNEWFCGNFEATLFEILDAMDYGFTVSEKIWDMQDGYVYLKELKTRPSQSFEFHQDDHGYLLPDGLKQWTKNNVISIPLDKVVIYSYNKKRDNYYGESDLRAAYRAWFSKDFTIKMMNIAIERMGNPLVVMKYPKTASSDERQDMQNIINSISGKTSLLFPQEAAIEFVQPPSNMDLFQKAIDIYNLSIMKAILMPEKMGFGGDTGGSYALGQVQMNTYLWILTKIRNELETIINENVIRQLIDLNFGEQEKYPRFKFKPLSEEDKDSKAKIIIDALSRGSVGLDINTENYLRTLLGLPEAEEGSYEQSDEEQEYDQVSESDESIVESKEKAAADDSKPRDIEVSVSESNRNAKEFKLRRKLTTYEEKVDFKRISKAQTDDVEEAIESLQEILVKIRDDFENQVIRKKIMETKNINAVKDLEFKYIRDYALEVEKYLRRGYQEGKGIAKQTYQKHKKSFAKATTNIGLVQGKSISYIKEKSRIIAGDISGKLQNKVKAIMADGVLNGDNVNVIVEKIDSAFAPYVAKMGESGYDFDGKYLKSIVNTEMSKAIESGMSEFNRDLEESGELVAYQWSAILDQNTTEGCEELDGLIYEVTNPAWSNLSVPRHWNCRSVLIPIFRDEDYVADEDIGVRNEF